MKLRFRIRPRGGSPRMMTVSVPFHSLVLRRFRDGIIRPLDISPTWIAAFEARHSAEVLEIRRPCRRVRA